MKQNVSKDAALETLLLHPNIKDAANVIGVSERTLYRYLANAEFAAQLAEKRREVAKGVMNGLILRGAEAAETLAEIMADKSAPPASRVSASRAVLEFALRSVEITNLIERIEQLEIQAFYQ